MNPLNDRITRRKIEKEFAEVINRNSLENESNTQDFLLAEYLVNCLTNFNLTVRLRAQMKSATLNNSIPTYDGNCNTVISNGIAMEEHPGLKRMMFF